jgi:hypothetical protein
LTTPSGPSPPRPRTGSRSSCEKTKRGDDSVIEAIGCKLPGRDVAWSQQPTYVRYEAVPKMLRPCLEAWSDDNFDLSGSVGEAWPDGLRVRYSLPAGEVHLAAEPGAYAGPVWLYVGPLNSSATFYTAPLFQSLRLAALVGRTTDGSQRGM